jgi:hypothetical protein
MLPLPEKAGARHSQSPIKAKDAAAMILFTVFQRALLVNIAQPAVMPGPEVTKR